MQVHTVKDIDTILENLIQAHRLPANHPNKAEFSVFWECQKFMYDEGYETFNTQDLIDFMKVDLPRITKKAKKAYDQFRHI